MRIVVYHQSYGCDTGCCGHYVNVEDGELPAKTDRFHFSHPYGDDPLDFARTLVEETFGAEHVADLDWDNCVIVDE